MLFILSELNSTLIRATVKNTPKDPAHHLSQSNSGRRWHRHLSPVEARGAVSQVYLDKQYICRF